MRRIWGLILAMLLLCGCTAAPAPAQTEPAAPPASAEPYIAPAFRDASFHGKTASKADPVQLDLSCVSEGYFAASAVSDKRLKLQVCKDDFTYNYDLPADGTPAVFPLQCGDGSYRFRIMENVSDNRYAELASETCEVTLEDEFQPFLRPSALVPYHEDDACVKLAKELAGSAYSQLDVVNAVFDYVCANISYDAQKAKTVETGYLPCPDETLESGKGICFDYAALAAAMLRSQGIPTKMIFGYVTRDGLYHAWNMYHTDETGWVTVSYETGAEWNRIDLTFSAGDADSAFVGNGVLYTDLYTY